MDYQYDAFGNWLETDGRKSSGTSALGFVTRRITFLEFLPLGPPASHK
jgi:hypothetical protein